MVVGLQMQKVQIFVTGNANFCRLPASPPAKQPQAVIFGWGGKQKKASQRVQATLPASLIPKASLQFS
jgi:hypothetical protein